MDLRQVLAKHEELLATSLSPSSSEFMYYLLSEHLISPADLKRHQELDTTLKKVADLLSLLCKSRNVDLAQKFLDWLKQTNQVDLHKMLIGPDDEADELAAITLEEKPTTSDYDDSGESDCESLSSKTSPVLKSAEKKPAPPGILKMFTDTSIVYPLTDPTRGLAILVINSNFKTKPARLGSEFDQANLNAVFTWLGYQVLTYSNLTKAELLSKLSTHIKDKSQRSYGSFILCMLSHGGVGYVTMSDDSEIYIDELIDRLDSNNFPAMAGKPKLIYIDCNNKELGSDSGLRPASTSNRKDFPKTSPVTHIEINQSRQPRGSETAVPESPRPVVSEFITKVACKADFAICMASFPRYSALHNSKMGSISTRVLVEVLYKYAHQCHIQDIAMKIRRKLCSKDLMGNKQVFTVIETLRKDFYLLPIDP